MGTVTRNILIVVKETGTTQLGTAMKGAAQQTEVLAKGQTALSGSLGKTRTGAVGLQTGITKLDKEEIKATKTTQNFGKAADQTGKKTGGLAAKFQGNKGAIFAFVGMASAGMEAVGMFGMYQSAADKVAEAQEKVNMLERAGATDTSEYRRAVDDVAEAQRGYNFILRNVAMSFGDLVPFTLLAINAIMKMKDTVAGSKPALDAATQGMNTLGNAARTNVAGSMGEVATSLTPVRSGFIDLDGTVRTAIGSSDELYTSSGRLVTSFDDVGVRVRDNTRLIGTRSNGLVGGVSALTLGMDQSQKASTKFREAFRQIGEQFRAIPGVLSNVGSGIKGFFTNFGTNITKFAGHLKTAGAAAMAFSKTLLMAILSNPITAAIAGISAAVLALATDFGGIRTAVNNFGVAIGNALPQAKGFLQWIGDMANGALDAIAGALGLQKEVKNVGTSAKESIPGITQFNQAIQGTLVVSKGFDTARRGIDNLTEGVGLLKGTVIGINTWHTSVLNMLTTTQKQSPAAAAALANLSKVVEDSKKPGQDLTVVKQKLNDALTQLQLAVNKEAMEQTKSVQVTQQKQNATLGLSEAETELAGQVTLVRAEMELDTKVQGQNAKAREEARKAVEAWIDDMGTANQFTDKQIASLIKNSASLELYGNNVAWAADGNIDLAKTIQNVVKENEMFAKAGVEHFGAYAAKVNEVGTSVLPTIEVVLEDLKNKHPEIGAVAEKLWDDYLENTVNVEGQLMLVNEAEEQQAEAVENTSNKLAEKAKKIQEQAEELGIWVDIQGKSIQEQEKAIKATEAQNKLVQELTQAYEDTSNATQIASDEISVWWAQLQRSQAIEDASVQKLLELAKALGVEIPDSAELTVESLKSVIEQELGVGDAAKKASEEAKKAFNDLVGDASSALENLIQEDVIKGDMDDVIEKLEDVGSSIDTLAAKKAIINIFLNDNDFTNKVYGLEEILVSEMGEMELAAEGGGDGIIAALTGSMKERLGSDAGPVVDQVNQIWEKVKAQNPGATGAVLIQKFLEAINQPAQFSSVGNTLGTSVSSGVASSIFGGASKVQNATLGGIVNPITGQIETVPGEAGTALAPVEGVFSQAFLNASMAATGVISLLLASIDTSMGHLVTNVSTKLAQVSASWISLGTGIATTIGKINTSIADFWNKLNDAFGKADQKIKTFGTNTKTSFNTANQGISAGMTAIDAFWKAWDSALGKADQKLNTFARNAGQSFNNVKKTADQARSSVDSLKKSIDALKSKTITITVRYRTVGSPGARFGGATVGYARAGDSWIQDTPTTLGGMHVSEFGKPELITATPLSNPFDITDKSINLPDIKVPTTPTTILSSSSTTLGRGSQQPIQVTGNLYVTVKTRSGQVLAEEVQPYLLNRYSGIT